MREARARMRIDDMLFKRYEKEKEQAAVAVQKAARGRDARKAAKGKATTATTAKAAKGAAADQQKGAAEAPLRPEDISQQDMLMIQVESAAEALAASQEEAATYKQGWEALRARRPRGAARSRCGAREAAAEAAGGDGGPRARRRRRTGTGAGGRGRGHRVSRGLGLSPEGGGRHSGVAAAAAPEAL